MLLYGQWYGEIQERLEAFGLTDAPRAGIDKMCAVARGGDELSAAVKTEPLTVFLVLGDLASEGKGRVEAFEDALSELARSSTNASVPDRAAPAAASACDARAGQHL